MLSDGTVTVTVDRTGLPDDTYTGFVHVTSNGGNADVPVAMLVDNTPRLGVSPTLLLYDDFTAVHTFAITNLGGATALQYTIGTFGTPAVYAQQPEIVRLLLHYGADPDIKNHKNHSAHLAADILHRNTGDPTILNILRQHAATQPKSEEDAAR